MVSKVYLLYLVSELQSLRTANENATFPTAPATSEVGVGLRAAVSDVINSWF